MTEPTQNTDAAGDFPGRPARPAGYWERIDRIVAAAPPLTAEQRIRLRAIFHRTPGQEAAA